MPIERPTMTIASDEDGATMFVLVDEAAASAERVERFWREEAKREWGIEYEEGKPIGVSRGWYKTNPDDDETVVYCPAEDPDRSEEWWSFELPAEADDA